MDVALVRNLIRCDVRSGWKAAVASRQGRSKTRVARAITSSFKHEH